MADFQEGTGGDGGSGGGSGLSAEGVRDVVGDYITQGDNITLTKNDAGDALTISAAEASGLTLEQLHDAVADDIVGGTGLTKTKDDGANTVTLDLDAAGTALGGVKTGGDLTFTAGVGAINTGVVPTKATATDWAQRTDDTKFLTVLGAATMEKSADDGTEWTGFTYVETVPTTGEFIRSRTNATGWEFEFATTATNAAAMDRIIGENSNIRIRVNASNEVTGKAAWAWRNGNTFGVRMKPNATVVGDITSGSVALWAQGALYGELKEQGFITSSDLVEGTDIDLTIGSDGRVTIAYVGTGSGVTYATQATATAGTSTDTAISPSTLHGVLDKLPHVADFSGFQHSTSAGGSGMALGTWHINSGGTTAYYRAHTATEHDAIFRDIVQDKRAQHISARGELLEYEFSAAPTEHSIDGQAVGYIQCAIGSHVADPPNPTLTGDWDIGFMPAQNKVVFEHAPRGSIPHTALALDLAGAAKGDSEQGGNSIGTTTFGTISWSDWNSSNLSATNSAFMALPHPNNSTTPAGQGEFTFTPQSASSKFRADFDIGFGFISDNNRRQVHLALLRKIGSGSWSIVGKKTNIVYVTDMDQQDVHISGFVVDSPNTTSNVTYKWVAVRGTTDIIYPVSQSISVQEIPR